MKQDKALKSPERRAFFRAAGVGVGATGAIALGVSAKTADAAIDDGKRADAGYRETAHVKKVYALSRF
jgi:hypothetical protein